MSRTLIVTPAKYSKSGKTKISENTLNKILALPRRNECLFSPSGNPERFNDELEHFTRNYEKIRKNLSRRLQNPRINMITLKTFRHWKATTLYLKTRDLVYVKEFLRHKNINNTMKYIHLANALSQDTGEWTCEVARTLDDACKLLEAGFEYVTEMDSVKIFKKRR